ncbi:MAG TPA: transglutaminase-like domain-containing protein [Bacteroidales bacterium]|nr:transglutaminase-like domain-containing protein [Bacteroidales bacterium]
MNDKSELQALISLVDEPDISLYARVRNRIFDYGMQAVPALEEAFDNCPDNLVQDRIVSLIHEIQQQHLYNELHHWKLFGGQDLLTGFLIVTRHQYPDLDIDNITRQVGRLIQDVYNELNPQLTPLEKTRVLNHVLYDINKFSGNTSNLQAPENFYIKNLLETRKGNPISLGMLYLLLARGMRIPIYGVDLPRHFVLAYLDERYDLPVSQASEEQVLFYLNPFNKGAVFTRNEIELYIRQLKLVRERSYFVPCDNVAIISRLINGLAEAWRAASNEQKAEELENLRKALED